MAEKFNPSFGDVNFDLMKQWLHRSPDDDRPVWMVNLMKYKTRAVYSDGEAAISGKEADDRYAPVKVLADLGAMVALHADVESQPNGEPRWDRIGIVRYPTRSSFMNMQRRDDFKKQYVHKEAGMEFTIIVACLPVTWSDEPAPPGSQLVMRVRRRVPGEHFAPDPARVVPMMQMEVEGTVIGDARRWDDVRFDWVDRSVIGDLSSVGGVQEQFVTILGNGINQLVSSAASSPPWR